jgi:hypothetical protein
LVRHRRMSGQEGTEKPWHPVGWTQNHILSNPLHRSRRVLANCRADPQFSTVRKIRGRSVILTSRPRRSLHRGRFRILDLHPMPARAAPVGAVAVLVPQYRLLACYWFRREGANEAALQRRRESIPTPRQKPSPAADPRRCCRLFPEKGQPCWLVTFRHHR